MFFFMFVFVTFLVVFFGGVHIMPLQKCCNILISTAFTSLFGSQRRRQATQIELQGQALSLIRSLLHLSYRIIFPLLNLAP